MTSRTVLLPLGLALALLLGLVPSAWAAPARTTGSACPAAWVPPSGLQDVDPGSVHAGAVECLVWWGITRGTSATTFEPAGTVTRAQMASFLARLVERAGGSLPAAVPDRFPDDTGSVHEASVNRLAAAGIATGLADGTFGAERSVTRGQMASFLARAAAHLPVGPLPAGPDAFGDDDGSAHEAAIAAAAEAGIASGVAERRYRPDAAVRRDQMASFLTRTADLAVAGRLGLVSVSVAGLPSEAAAPGVTATAASGTARRASGAGVIALPSGTWTVSGSSVPSEGGTWTVESRTTVVTAGQATAVGLLYASPATGPVAADVEALVGRDAEAVVAYETAAREVRIRPYAAARVQTGEVLLAEPSPAAPDGLLLRVTGTRVALDGGAVVTGTPATLADVYPEGTATLVVQPETLTFTPEPGVAVVGTAGAQVAGGRAAQAVDVTVAGPTLHLDLDTTIGVSEPFRGVDPGRAWQPERGVFVSLDGPVEVTPSVRVKVGSSDAAVGIETRTRATLDVGVGAATVAAGAVEAVARKELGRVEGQGCHAFVCVTLAGKVVVVVSAGGELRYDLEVDTRGRVLGGVRVDASGQRPWVEGESTLTVRPEGATGEGAVETFVALEGSVKLYGVVGPFVAGGLYGGVEAAVHSDGRPPDCAVEGGARLVYGLQSDLRILGRGVEAFAQRSRDFPLVSSDCTLRGPSLPPLTLGLGGSLGDLGLLAPEVEAVSYLTARLGAPTWDNTEQMCDGGVGAPGRTLVWGPLRVLVLDDLSAYEELGLGPVEGPAVVGWEYHTVTSPDTLELRTEQGVGLGSTLEQLRAAYPDGDVFEELGFPTYEVFRGDLSNVGFVLDEGRVVAMWSGSTCPE